MFAILITKSQTCNSPIVIPVNGSFTPIDSFSVNARFFSFVANYPNIRIKAWIKNYTSSGNYQVKLYNDSCGNLTGNKIPIIPSASGDSVSIIALELAIGNTYLIELSKINPSSDYIVYKMSVNNFILSLACTTCVPTSTCELVCNGSFECLVPSTTVTGIGQLSAASSWTPATFATPDLFSSAATSTDVQVPCNWFGNQPAFGTGNNYAGINWYDAGYSEYIETQLTNTMQPTKKYIISFYVSRAENPIIDIKNLGVFLTNTIVAVPGGGVLTLTPVAIFTNTVLLNNKTVWQRLSFCYTAVGGEQFLTIGRANTTFTATSTPSTTPLCTGLGPGYDPFSMYGYFYIDEVSVRLFDVAGPNLTTCPGISSVLSPSFACNAGIPNINLTYSWSPAATLSSGSVLSPTATPTNTTNYILNVTATGENSLTCSVSGSVTVNVYTVTSLSISASSTIACPSTPFTLTATGGAGVASTYTWQPSVGTLTGNPIVVTPTLTTTYTVFAPDANGCIISGTVAINIYTVIPFFTVTANPTVVCTGLGGTSTLTASGSPGTFSWSTGATNVSTVSVSAGTYTVTLTNTLGCTSSQTISVGNTVDITSLTSNTICVSTGTVDLGIITSAIPYPSGTFSVNGSPTSNVYTPSVSGTYVIGYTYTAGITCNNTATTTLVVMNTPPTLTIVPSNTIACLGTNFSLTAIPTTSIVYTWFPGGFVGNPYVFTPVFNPTMTITTYTVIGGAGTCTVSAVFAVDTKSTPCVCLQNCNNEVANDFFGPLTVASSSVYCVTASINIFGAVTFSNSDFKVSPNVTITVVPNSTLTIAGCHLYSCENMWQGIDVKSGGVLNFIPSSTLQTSFIEDAFVAVNIQNYTSASTNILTTDNVMFNRNQVSIKLNGYNINQNNYPFTIKNCLITCRTISFSPLSWPLTNTVKNSASGGTILQSPYISPVYSPTATLKAPLSGTYPTNGIVLNNIGFTSVPSFPVYKGITIGQNGTNNYNVFDNLVDDISANNSNFTVINSVFQNGRPTSRGASGRGIVAVSTQLDISPDLGNPVINNQIRVIPGGGNNNFHNKFYELTRSVEIRGYLSTEITGNEVFSSANSYSLFTTVNTIGNLGFALNTNRYYQIIISENKMYNIKNNILFDIGKGFYSVGTLSGNGRYIGHANIDKNIISRHPTTATAQEYVNVGVNINDAFATATFVIAPVGTNNLSVSSNSITNAHNGVGASNVSFSPINIISNTITLVNEPSIFFFFPLQNGITTAQLGNVNIWQNNITGPLTYTNDVRAIKTSMNNNLSVRCNTVDNTVRGLDFNASQAVTDVEDNVIQITGTSILATYGLSLDNNAMIGVQGSSVYPQDNQWLGTNWSPTVTTNFKTLTFGAGSSASFSKMYVQTSTVSTILDPNGSSQVLAGAVLNSDDYFHQVSNPNNTLLNVTISQTPGCRIPSGGGGNKPAQRSLMEQLVTNAILYPVNATQTRFIDKNRVFRTIKSDNSWMVGSTTLSNFYTTSQIGCLQSFVDIENELITGTNASSQTKINAFAPISGIETNYKNYFQILHNVQDSTYSSSDSLALITLANSCPYIQGGCVYQARALHNIIYKVYLIYKDNCTNSGSRLFNPEQKENVKEINVILKSKIFPNPNSGDFYLSISEARELQTIEIFIYDISGKLIFSETKTSSNNILKLNSDLANGMYLVKIKLPDGSIDVHRLVINK